MTCPCPPSWLARILHGTLANASRGERQLIGDYERTIGGLLDTLDAGNVGLAAEIAGIPKQIRGYGHVKEAHLHKAKAREAELLREWSNPLRIVQAA